MFIYNVTTKLDWSIHEAWLQWMQDIHIPEVLGTGCFSAHQFVRIMETDDTDGPTYAIQYYAETKSDYNKYIELYAPALRKAGMDLWGDKFISFRTLMEIVH